MSTIGSYRVRQHTQVNLVALCTPFIRQHTLAYTELQADIGNFFASFESLERSWERAEFHIELGLKGRQDRMEHMYSKHARKASAPLDRGDVAFTHSCTIQQSEQRYPA